MMDFLTAYLPYFVAAWVVIVGLYGISTSRHLVHLVGCLLLVQSGTYILLLAVGFRSNATAPVFESAAAVPVAVDPVVQAMALTDIVVGAVVAALLLALAIQTRKRFGTLNPDELRATQG